MANQNGKKYGFTALFPIKRGPHAAELRRHLRSLDSNPNGSPLSETRVIHMARFAIIDQLAYQGLPAKRESLVSSYLLFLCEFDGESPDVLVRELIDKIPAETTEVWQHCVAFPGIESSDRVAAYFEQCQLETNLFLADRPDDRLDDILRALKYKQEFAELILWLQRASPAPADLKQRFRELWDSIEKADAPHPGSL